MNLMDIRQQLAVLNRRADMHIDIMDGHYVKNITLSPFFVEQIRPHTSLLLDVHLMVEEPDRFHRPDRPAPARTLSARTPKPSTTTRFGVINQIRALGKKWVVLNPATPVEFIRHYLHLDKVTVMTHRSGLCPGSRSFPKCWKRSVSCAI